MADPAPLAHRWFDAVHARDWDAVAAMYAPDADYVRADGASKGPEDIVAYLTAITGAFPDHVAQIDAVYDAGSAITIEWTETGTHTEPYLSSAMGTIPPTGNRFEAKVVDVIRIDDGRITSQHEYYDLLSMLRQLGWLQLMVGDKPGP